MKISYIELAGGKHPLCFSLSATEEICNAFGDTDKMADAITKGSDAEKIKAIDKVLTILLAAGRRYCEAVGMELPPAIKGRPADVIDITSSTAIEAIFDTLKADTERTVVAQSKNGEPTQGD